MPDASSTPTPQEKLTSLLRSLQFDLENLQSGVQLASVRDSLEDLDTQVNGMPERIKDLRTRGYVFARGLETKAQDIRRRWLLTRSNVEGEISRQAARLQTDLTPLENQFTQVQSRAQFVAVTLPAAERLDSAVDTLKSKVSAAERTIRGMYDSFASEANTLKSELDRIEWMLEQLSEGCFQLLATEGCVAAVNATLSRDDEKMEKDDPKGVLYLTDQRLIFEQKQEIATKKVLFITTEKQKVQQVVMEVAVSLVEDVQASKKGMFGNEDHLAISFKTGAPFHKVWLHLDGQDCHLWDSMIGRVRTADYDKDRAVGIDKSEEEKVRSAPSQCPNCGAPMNATVLRGQTAITCEYCQFVVRL